MQPETRFKNKVRKKLDAIPKSYWVKNQMRSLRGVLDFTGVVNWFPVYLELKTMDGRLDALQNRNLYKIEKAGAYVAVVDPSNVDLVVEHLTILSGVDHEKHMELVQKFVQEIQRSGKAARGAKRVRSGVSSLVRKQLGQM